MVVLPAGQFQMGSSAEERRREGVPVFFGHREEPAHTVTLAKPFAMSRTEITRGQFAAFAKATQRPVLTDCRTHDPVQDDWLGVPRPASWRDPGFAQTDDHPAACMTWTDAADYAAWLSKTTGHRYHLPTEAQWEYAARGGTQTARYWGDEVQDICARIDMMNAATVAAIGAPESWKNKLVCSTGPAWTVPVGSYAANPFGLYDMLGSVWEWTADCAHDTYQGAPTDGSAWDEPGCRMHSLRGGALHSEAWLARAATRGKGMDITFRPVAAGFRVARDLD
jgi:formylglycine-generating enzyme required for sulfatase activity